MAGKYSHLIDNLIRTLNTDAKHQEKVDAAKATISGTPADLADLYRTLRGEKDELNDQLSEIQVRVDAVAQLLSDAYEQQGITSLKLDDGASVSVQLEPYARVEDKEAFRLWCLANGLERSMALPWTTANALTKERLLEGAPEPDGVTAVAITKIVLRKG